MVIMILENYAPGLRGELTQWFLEIKSGVLVGNISAVIREALWDKVCASTRADAALMLYSADTEQGFQIKMTGDPKRSVEDLEGIFLIKTKQDPPNPLIPLDSCSTQVKYPPHARGGEPACRKFCITNIISSPRAWG